MDAETHGQRMLIRDSMKTGKGTELAYPRHVKNYVDFMVSDQAKRAQEDPTWIAIPPFPITAQTVAAFLMMETTRMKLANTLKKNSDGQCIPGTRLGVESIKQCISALENWRHNHEHEFKDNPDALRSLRDDSRIQTFEAKAQASESE
ncbi:hypothetical protein H0H92_000245, partial [Tricholoma furcatifolium]